MEAELTAAWLQCFALLIPEMILGAAACLLFFGGTLRLNRHYWGTIAILAILGAGFALRFHPATTTTLTSLLVGSVLADPMALYIKVVALVGGGLLVLSSWNEVREESAAEYHACLLLMTAGACITGAANDLVTLFLGLELTSIPTYVLLSLARSDRPGLEASMKYFMLSVFSSALLLFGFSYLYGIGGTTNLYAIADALHHTEPGSAAAGFASIALVTIVAGLGFRITAVPFHAYAPDVYQGTSPGMAATLAFVPKIVGFVSLLRLLGFVVAGHADSGLLLSKQVPSLLWILAAVTMTLGNVLALLQDNIKRMLAYSSVAHAGYMLIGLASAPVLSKEPIGGTEAALFYLVAYGSMTIGAFTVLIYLSTPERRIETVDDLAGLSRAHPGVALMMGLFLLSLIGIPLTAGFAGKLLLFFGAMAAPEGHAYVFRVLALIGALNAAMGAWYYLRILVVMYLRSPIRPIEVPASIPGLASLWICSALTLGLGVYPYPLVEQARLAVGRTPTQPVAIAKTQMP